MYHPRSFLLLTRSKLPPNRLTIVCGHVLAQGLGNVPPTRELRRVCFRVALSGSKRPRPELDTNLMRASALTGQPSLPLGFSVSKVNRNSSWGAHFISNIVFESTQISGSEIFSNIDCEYA